MNRLSQIKKKGKCPCCASGRTQTLYLCPSEFSPMPYYCAECCASTIGYHPRSKVPFDLQMATRHMAPRERKAYLRAWCEA